jgi:hypothetical protein
MPTKPLAAVTSAHRLLIARAWEGDGTLSTFIQRWIDGEPHDAWGQGVAGTLESLERMAQLLADAEPRWVLTSERLPALREVVMFCTPDEHSVSVGHTNGKVWLDLLDMYAGGPQEYDMSAVRAWRPLPQPPEGT